MFFCKSNLQNAIPVKKLILRKKLKVENSKKKA